MCLFKSRSDSFGCSSMPKARICGKDQELFHGGHGFLSTRSDGFAPSHGQLGAEETIGDTGTKTEFPGGTSNATTPRSLNSVTGEPSMQGAGNAGNMAWHYTRFQPGRQTGA